MGVRARGHILVVLAASAAALPAGCAAPSFGLFQDRPSAKVSVADSDRQTFDEGVALASQLRYADAAEKFSRVLGRFSAVGDRTRAAETMFWLGFCHEKQGRVDQAKGFYNRLMDLYADTAAARQASKRMVRLTEAGPRGRGG
jgi:tetratricopeptide (TPR) repeat protein